MESKKINQLATNLAPVNTDLTVIGNPLTGELKKITLLQIASLFGAGLTSVGMVVPSGFSVSPATLTSSGTFTITGAGTSAEYIDGTGALQTFPTLLSSDKLIHLVRNNSGATISKGTIIYINGALGNKPTIAKALATGDATSAQTYGVAQTDISNNADGNIVVIGDVENLDTSAVTEGTQLYLSGTTAGAYTATKPYAPTHLVYVAIVLRSHPTLGIIGVKIQNGYEMDELHNVSAQSPANNDGLFYNTTTSLWEKNTIAGVLGYTPVTSARTISTTSPLSGGGDLTANRTLSIAQSTGSTSGYLSSTDWNTFNNKQGTITLTTTGSSGASTLITNTLNVPTYTLAGLGGQPLATNLTSLAALTFASTSFVKMTAAGTFALDTTIYTSNTGTVTSVAMSVPTGLTIGGSPITTNGTLALTFTAGYSIPTTTSQTNWDTAYTNRITSLTTTGSSGSATLVTNTLNIPTYTLAGLGGQASSTNLTSLAGLTYVSASFVKMTAAGTFSLDTATYLTANQSITLSGDISGTGTTAITTAIGTNKVTNAMLAQIATGTFHGRLTAGTGNVETLTGTQATTLLDTFTTLLKGLVPASGGGTTNFLRADGTWSAPSGIGTVTTVSVVSANGFAGTVATATSTPAITLTTSITGILKGNGTAISSAVSGTDYQAPSTNLTSLSGLTYVSASFVKMTATGTFSLDTATYLTANQSITLSGDVSGTGSTAITTAIGTNKVTNAMLAQIATASFHGRLTAGTGNVETLTGTQATTLLDVFSSTLKGLAPASGGGTTNFLRADGTWSVPSITSTNIYNTDGTLTGTRAVTMGANNISFTSTARTSATAFQISATQTTANATDTLDSAIGVDFTFNASTGTELVTRAMNFRTYSTGVATLTNMRAWNIGSNTSAGSTTTNLDQVYIEKGVTALGTVTNNRAIYIASMQGTNQAGLVINDLGTTGNTTAILIGASSGALQTGDYGIYQVDTKANVFFGSIGVGIVPTIPLDIVRGTAGTMARNFYESASVSYNADTKFGIYTASATATDGASLYLGQTNLLNSASQYGGFELQYRYNSSTTENLRINYVSRLATGAVSTSVQDLFTLSKTGVATFLSSVTATSFIKTSGTSSQILVADGSVITAGTNITISGGVISATGGSGSVSQLSGFVDQTLYSLLVAPSSGPQIRIRYDSATTNRYLDLGFLDNTLTIYTSMMQFSNGNAITANVPFTQSINQNQSTQLNISNTTAGTLSNALLKVTSDATAGYTLLGKLSSTYTSSAILNASDSAFLNYTLGNLVLLNTYASGKIVFGVGSGSTPLMTLTSDGHLLINTTTNSTYFLDSAGATRVQTILTLGTNATSTVGDLQIDSAGKLNYTHNTSEKAVVCSVQYVQSQTSTPYGAAFTTARPLFSGLTGATNGAITLKANTRYHFEMLIYLTGLSATSSTFGVGFTGTVGVSNMFWQTQASKSSSPTTAGADSNTANYSTTSPLNSVNTIICTAATGTTAYARVIGWIRTGTSGTFIPNINLSASATPTLIQGSYFKIFAVSDNTTETLGAWS